jgi:hypothetical protein
MGSVREMSDAFNSAFDNAFDTVASPPVTPPPVPPGGLYPPALMLAVALHDRLAPLVQGRVHPQILPERPVYPCIRYANVGGGPDNTLCGRSSLNIWRYRIDIFARTAMEMHLLRDLVTNVMDDFSMPCLQVMDMDGYEPEVRVFRRMLDYSIHQQEDRASAGALQFPANPL